MANSKKKSQNKPDIILTFSSPERAENFCAELKQLLPDVKFGCISTTVRLWAPPRTFDAIKDLSCQLRFRRTACSVHTNASK
ncbi:MAG: hypothetical protein HFJ29_02530 [Clostridia bacterium]|nr:hypothetical protein [Clostridia bacterium]